MQILCDKPSELKKALGEGYKVEFSPALDIYTKENKILRTLKGMYFSSKLDFEDEGILTYIKEIAKPVNLPEPVCHTCYNYEDFDNFCKEFIDNQEEQIRIAYDVETTAAHYLSTKYKLAGFSLASKVSDGCYVILSSLDYENPDKEQILQRLSDIIKKHTILVFNSQHEYIATKRCVNVDLQKNCPHLDDAYAMALTLKTESFRPDVFKLKLLCHRLLGTENWAGIIDDYIEVAMQIARSEKIDFNNLTEDQKEMIVIFRDILKEYDYTNKEIISFIKKLQDSYVDWQDQDMLPYSLIPSKLINVYGCYDACYLIALFDYFIDWTKELDAKLQVCINKPKIWQAYEEVVSGQIMSAILTVNGIFISEKRDNEVKEKSKVLAEERYNKLWDIISDSSGTSILREFCKNKHKEKLRKNYLLPLCLEQLIPEGFRFIKTTPSFYSFECEILDLDLINYDKDEEDNTVSTYLIMDDTVKVYKKDNKYYCKLLQKHLLPYESLKNEDELTEQVLDEFLQDSIKKDGTLSKEVFKPMSGPRELYDILNKDFKYSKFLDRVVLYEHDKLPEKQKSPRISKFLEEHLLYDFNTDPELYSKAAKIIKSDVLDYMKKQYSYKEIYEKLVSEGIKSFASPIIAYIYNVYTATGCSVKEPLYSAFDFICQLKICRKYMRINSTFIYGSSGGYSSQMKVYKDSINDEFLTLADTTVLDKETDEPYYTEDTNSVAFGAWYADCADTGRWQATVHNVPAGPYCKRRFTSRFPGGVILANDMSQAEVRELAMVSKCTGLIETIKDPTVDMHRRTAHLAFNVPYDDVTSAQRKQAKEGVFSVVYGRDESSLAQSLFKGDKASAKRLMDSIFKVYPEIPQYLDDALDNARETGYLVTRRGEPIFVNPYTSADNAKGEQAWIRNTRNYAIQGGASFWCTNTLVNVQKLLDKYNMKSKLICYIHDSIELDVAPDEFDMAMKIMNYAFNELATKQFGVITASDSVVGVSMGDELEIKRIEDNHYKIEGNNNDILELFEQFGKTYTVDIISSEVEETQNLEDNVEWIFTPRAQLQWFDEITPAKYEFKLIKNN